MHLINIKFNLNLEFCSVVAEDGNDPVAWSAGDWLVDTVGTLTAGTAGIASLSTPIKQIKWKNLSF